MKEEIQELRVNRIVLVDSKGNERGIIGFCDNDDLITIDLWGKTGGAASMSVTGDNEAFFRLASPDGKTGVAMAVTMKGGAGISTYDRSGALQITISSESSEKASIKLKRDGVMTEIG